MRLSFAIGAVRPLQAMLTGDKFADLAAGPSVIGDVAQICHEIPEERLHFSIR